ncbi:alpha/beta fold hydrolase [Paenibacillus methanolicus]|uniref:Alpha/beta hydrolase family protein n=1 Tax=Paenibacillus methanolicus TaxID=582686 RepID=A0A5S5CD67_9BACL|nr:alpha/beta fold hydrolase [Paenibacillus methanolicus]TYP76452.1 alpha/beta hydrolase family protein [Paenibacillus methanolicus]
MTDPTNALPPAKVKPARRRWRKALYWAAAIVFVLIVGGFVALNQLTYEPEEEALAALQSGSGVTVVIQPDGFYFEPATGDARQPAVILYPGGMVEPESYAPLARAIAERGHRVYVVSMPLNLAMFGANRADGIIANHPEDRYVIGGHSLGGVFAARYAAKHPDTISGAYFLASYADEGGSLSGSQISALQITGTKDGVMNAAKWEEAKTNLPGDTTYIAIKGANHGQFGLYGKQKGDNDADISSAEQVDAVADAMIAWMDKLEKKE